MKIKEEFTNEYIEVGEVKPCPFCGEKELRISSRSGYDILCKKNGESMISLDCKVCDTTMSIYDIPDNNYDMGVGMLIARWNNRREK